MKEKAKEKAITPMKAIRQKCMGCMCGTAQEIKACSIIDCALWKFRLGKRPYSEKGKANPFLNEKNFKGKEALSSGALIKTIDKKK